MINEFNKYDWGLFIHCKDINHLVSAFTWRLKATVNYLLPEKLSSNNQKKNSPGITRKVRLLIKKRKNSYKRFKRNKTPTNYYQYKSLRKQVTATIRNNRRSIISSCFSKYKNSRKFWRQIDAIGLTKRASTNQRHQIPCNFSADKLNKYFLNNGQPHSPAFLSTRWSKFTPRVALSSFRFHPVSSADIKRILAKINSGAAGVDGISSTYIKAFGKKLFPYLACIFNFSLVSAQFPDLWKIAIITPLAKVSHPTTEKKIRPLSNVPFLSKILEKFVHEQITEYLNTHDLQDKYQTGFKLHQGTLTAVTYLLDTIRLGIEYKQVTSAIFFRFYQSI